MVVERFTRQQVAEYFEMPFIELMFLAQKVHREHHDPLRIQLSTLLSIKTGACVEDCGYCSQSARYKTCLEAEPLMMKKKFLKMLAKPASMVAHVFVWVPLGRMCLKKKCQN